MKNITFILLLILVVSSCGNDNQSYIEELEKKIEEYEEREVSNNKIKTEFCAQLETFGNIQDSLRLYEMQIDSLKHEIKSKRRASKEDNAALVAMLAQIDSFLAKNKELAETLNAKDFKGKDEKQIINLLLKSIDDKQKQIAMMKNEIENKINVMIKSFNQDISAFLNNMEEIASEKQKLKKLERNQIELETTREELKEKIHEQTKLKREIELLKMENVRLKNICDSRSGNHTRSNSRRLFSPSFRESIKKSSNTNTPALNQTQKKLNVRKSYFNTNIKKDVPERNKSPLNAEFRKSQKLTGLTMDEKNKVNKTKLKKEKEKEKGKGKDLADSKSNTEIKTEPNVFKNLKSHQNIFKNNNKDNKSGLAVLRNKIFRKNNKSFNKNNKSKIGNKDNKLLNKTTRNFNKKKMSKNIVINNTDHAIINNYVNKKKKNVNDSFEKENLSNSDNDNDNNNDMETKSQVSLDNLDDDDEKDMEEEINEMNEIEDEILSLMGQIKDFENNYKNLT